MDSIYFDSAVFLAIFNGESNGPDIRALLKELKRDKVKIQTSIITIQEVSVLGFCRGQVPTDNHSKVERLARIQGMTRETALNAARLEAMMKDTAPEDSGQKTDENKRRKWDCFHIATAIELKCRTLYTCDPRMLALKERLGISDISFSHPRPRNLGLPGIE